MALAPCIEVQWLFVVRHRAAVGVGAVGARAVARERADGAAIRRRDVADRRVVLVDDVVQQVVAVGKVGAGSDRTIHTVDAVAVGILDQVVAAFQEVAVAAGQLVVAVPLDSSNDAALLEVPAIGERALEHFTAAFGRNTAGNGQFRALEILLGDQVDHAGHRVGTVDGR
ncbi:hypothetical protein D3C71_1298590 [compost metagenome]